MAKSRQEQRGAWSAQRALRGGGNRGLWIGAAIVVVIAAAVILGVVLSRGDTQRQAGATDVPQQPIRTATGRATPRPGPHPPTPRRPCGKRACRC